MEEEEEEEEEEEASYCEIEGWRRRRPTLAFPHTEGRNVDDKRTDIAVAPAMSAQKRENLCCQKNIISPNLFKLAPSTMLDKICAKVKGAEKACTFSAFFLLRKPWFSPAAVFSLLFTCGEAVRS